MSDEKKKNGDYEKPESHGEGDELEGVSGGSGSQPGNCYTGPSAQGYCGTGSVVTATSCTRGESPHPV